MNVHTQWMGFFTSMLILLAALGLVLALYYGLWQVWLHVIPTVWVTVPAELANIGFWTFLGAIVLIQFIFNLLTGK